MITDWLFRFTERIAFMMLFFVITSCGTSKRSVQCEKSSVIRDSLIVNVDSNEAAWIAVKSHVNRNALINLHWVRYDTTKPPDEHGNRQILEEANADIKYNQEDTTSIHNHIKKEKAVEITEGKEDDSRSNLVNKQEKDSRAKGIPFWIIVLFFLGFSFFRMKR